MRIFYAAPENIFHRKMLIYTNCINESAACLDFAVYKKYIFVIYHKKIKSY